MLISIVLDCYTHPTLILEMNRLKCLIQQEISGRFHIGPPRGHIANSMALKNLGIWLKILALGYIV
jgi:hypothetical protein